MKKFLFAVCVICICSCSHKDELPVMVTVQGGSFDMGSNNVNSDETPLHKVTISSFKMSKCEVTVAEFAAFINATGYRTDAEKSDSSMVFCGGVNSWKQTGSVTWRDDEEGHRRNNKDWNKPVVHVSWNDAIAYCQWLSHQTGKTCRLPTEAEWEYAAGNGSKHTTYSWGNYAPGKNDRVANVRDETIHPKYGRWEDPKFTGYNDGYFFAAPVGSYAPNDFGLYDMSGNVWEWCNDLYDQNYYATSPVTDPQGASKSDYHVIRGGGWRNDQNGCRVAFRGNRLPNSHRGSVGFRVASSL